MDRSFLQTLFDELFILYTIFVDIFAFKESVEFQAPVQYPDAENSIARPTS
jgi:hypothetical protein